jgi:hypothetical protein
MSTINCHQSSDTESFSILSGVRIWLSRSRAKSSWRPNRLKKFSAGRNHTLASWTAPRHPLGFSMFRGWSCVYLSKNPRINFIGSLFRQPEIRPWSSALSQTTYILHAHSSSLLCSARVPCSVNIVVHIHATFTFKGITMVYCGIEACEPTNFITSGYALQYWNGLIFPCAIRRWIDAFRDAMRIADVGPAHVHISNSAQYRRSVSTTNISIEP